MCLFIDIRKYTTQKESTPFSKVNKIKKNGLVELKVKQN